MIAIVDYGMGNLFSIYNALNQIGLLEDCERSGGSSLANADGIVIPGVGAFGRCMDSLSRFRGPPPGPLGRNADSWDLHRPAGAL